MTPQPPPTRPSRRARPAWPAAVGGVAVGTLITAVAYLGSPSTPSGLAPWLGTPSPAGNTATPQPRTPSPTSTSPRSTKTTAAWPTLPTATATPAPIRRSPSSARPTDGTAVDLTAGLQRGIVLIEGVDGNYTSAGTGMVLTEDGLVLTNYHVVRSTTELTVEIAASGRRYEASLVGRDATKDVALLKLDGADGLATITPDLDAVATGDRVVAAGNAAGQGYLTAFSGGVLATGQSLRVKGTSPNDPDENLTGLIQTDAHAEPGDSGGPLFDAEEEVLGMTTAGARTGGDQIASAFAVPIATALAVTDQIRAGQEEGSVVIGPKPSLGILAVTDSQGVRVKSVTQGSAAAKAGIRAGAHLTRLGDVQVGKTTELAEALDRYQPGDTVTVGWTTAQGTKKSAKLTFDASQHN